MNDWSGPVSISSDKNTLAIGATGNDGNGNGNYWPDSGHVRVFDWNGSAWAQRGADIDGEAASVSGEGLSLKMPNDGNTIAIGAYYANSNLSGHVRVFDWDGSAWVQRGSDIDGEAANDHSGHWVSTSNDGNTVAISAEGNDGNGTDSGHVRVFDWDGSAWVQRGEDIDGEAAGDKSMYLSMSNDGNTVAIGAEDNDGNGTDSGHVRVFDWNGSAWVQRGEDIDGEAAGDNFSVVSMNNDGNTVAVGAWENDGNGQGSGHARVFDWNGSAWAQRGSDIDGEAAGDWASGVAISSDGNTLALGAQRNDGNGLDSGHVRIFDWK